MNLECGVQSGADSTNCGLGLRAQIDFQSCWNGKDLNSTDNSHVAYLSDISDSDCPATHPYQFVHLFIEIVYHVNSGADNNGTFVFSQGDPTGYGFHGDFFNGWDPKVLAGALAEGYNGCAKAHGGPNTIDTCLRSTDCETRMRDIIVRKLRPYSTRLVSDNRPLHQV
jgi:hypothetical protein